MGSNTKEACINYDVISFRIASEYLNTMLARVGFFRIASEYLNRMLARVKILLVLDDDSD